MYFTWLAWPLTETYDPADWQEVLPFHLSQVIAEERAKFDKWTSDVKQLQVCFLHLTALSASLCECIMRDDNFCFVFFLFSSP